MEVDVCPSTLAPGHSTYSEPAIRNLFGGIRIDHNLDIDTANINAIAEMDQDEKGRISLSGVQPKRSMLIDTEDRRLRFAHNDEQGTFLAKPVPYSHHLLNRDDCPANENLTMQLAAQVYGIETAYNGLAFFRNDEPIYITRRFDVGEDGKYPQEDFASLLGYTRAHGDSEYKYCNGSYEEMGEVIRKHVGPWMIDALRLFEIIIFNFLTLNDDAHLKNFSLSKSTGEYRLSPAYDLINTSLHLSKPRIFALDKGLFREGMSMSDVSTIGKKEFLELGRRLGLPTKTVNKTIVKFTQPKPMAKILIENSFLSEETKRQYWLSYDFRRKMIEW